MFGRQDRFKQMADERRARLDAYCLIEAEAKSITKLAAELKLIADPTERREAALVLLEQAQAQSTEVRRAILQKGYEPSDGVDGSVGPGDYATYSGEGIASITRDYICAPQTVWAALSDQFPEVRFSADWFDIASLVAAEIRYWRIAGIIQGLDIANPPSRP